MQAKREVKRISRLMKKKWPQSVIWMSLSTHVETKRAAYQVSYYNLDKAQIYAPFAGVVLARNTELGEFKAQDKKC